MNVLGMVLFMKFTRVILLPLLSCLFIFSEAASACTVDKDDALQREKYINTLHSNFQYDKNEIALYLDRGIKYLELKNICLHAYAAQKPLADVVKLRDKYVWSRVKYILELTPDKFAERELEYKAERLERLFGLEKKYTKKYMLMGYSSHQVKRAIFISRKIDMPVEKILAMKTRQKKWGDICEQLGLPRDACMK